MSFKELKDRIKKNEGYSDKPYQDQLGFYTIGYGHLITEKEDKYFFKKFKKKHFEELFEIDALTGEKLTSLESIKIYANSHYVTPRPTLNEAIKSIKSELKLHLDFLYKSN